VSTFTDDFERGDGGLGNDWTVVAGSAAIASGEVTLTTATVRQGAISASGRQEAILQINVGAIGDLNQGPIIKMGASDQSGYVARATGTLASPTWNIYRLATNGGTTTLGTWGGSACSTGTNTIRLLFDSGVVTLWVNGALIGRVFHSEWAANTSAGARSFATTTGLDSYTLLGDETTTLTVSPDPIGNFNNSTTVTFTGVGTAWSSGTPGTPTFSVDHGTLSNQEVTSATSATATYTPGNFLGTATFTDPSTGATDTVTVTSDATVLPPPGTWLAAEDVAYIHRSAIAQTNPTILNADTLVGGTGEEASAAITLGDLRLSAYKATYTVEGDPSTAALLYTLWRLINGQYDPPVGPYPTPNFDSIDAGLGLVKGDLDALMGESEWTLPDVIAYLGGDPIASNRDIMTAIAALDFDDTAILDAIAAAQGDPLATIKAVLDYLFAMRTAEEYTLGNIKTWVESVQGSGLPTVKDVADRLALIQPTTTNSIDDILTKTVGQTTLQSIVDLAILALAGEEGATIAAVLSGIGDLTDLLNGLTVSVNAPPVWPGIDGVTLGDPIALASQLTIEEPMDGCLVDVTGVDGGVAFYTYGGVKAYRNVGALCFLTDQGDLEDWQLLGREHAIYTPRTMTHAAGIKLFTGHGLVGTVTPWTVD